MSLISAANFTAPFKQRFHLITILLVTIVFATLRYSGASVEMKPRNAPDFRKSELSGTEFVPSKSLNREENATEEKKAGPEVDAATRDQIMRALQAQRAQQPKTQPGTLSIGHGSQDDLVEEMMRPRQAPPAQNRARDNSAQEQNSGSGSLSEIEKQLGLK